MSDSEYFKRRKQDRLPSYEIKIPKGTVIKIEGSAMMLQKAIYLVANEEEGKFQLADHNFKID